jgi:hypothetical protein
MPGMLARTFFFAASAQSSTPAGAKFCKRLGIMSQLFLSILLFLFGIWCFLDGRENEAFQLHGETAQILSVENPQVQHKYKRGRGFGEEKLVSTSYIGDLTFRTKAGDIVTVPARTLPYGMLDAMKNRQVVLVQYLPEDPTNIRFDDRIESVTPAWLKSTGILVAIFGAICVVLTIRK